MRLYEFTNAQEQLGLLRIIIDNTWTAIAQQAKQQKEAEAQRKAQTKATPRKAKGSKRMSVRTPTPHTQQAYPKPTPTQNPIAPRKPLPTPTTNSTQPIPPLNLATAPKDGYLGRNVSATEMNGRGDDGHSENGIATLKKLPR